MKKTVGMLLILAMLMSAIPMAAFAGEEEIRPIAAATAAKSEGKWHTDQGDISAIIDGEDRTFFMRIWTSIPEATTFDLTLDKPYDLSAARIVWGGSYSSSAAASKYDVFVSEDGVLYTKAASVTEGGAAGQDHRRTDVLPLNAQTVKYVRLCVYGQIPDSCLALSEVSFKGSVSAAPEKKIYPTVVRSSQENKNYPTANLTDGNAATFWHATEWQQGSEGGDSGHSDAVLTAMLPHATDLTVVEFSLTSYFPDGTTNFYNRKSNVKAFEIEVSENGVDYRKVARFDGNVTAMCSQQEANFTAGCSVRDFTGSVRGVKYVRITFKNYSRLALNDLRVRGNDTENGLRTNGVQIRLSTQTTHAGMRFAAQAVKAELGIDGTYDPKASDVQLGMMLLPKKLLETSGFDTIAALFESGKTEEILDIPAQNLYAQDDETVTFAAVLTRIPVDSFGELLCAVPYVKKNGKTRFGKQIERSYTDVAQTANFTYPAEEAWAVNTEDFLREIDGKLYFDVSAASKVTPVTDDWSRLFPTDAAGFYLDADTVAPVDYDTFYRLLDSSMKGEGAFKWKDFKTENWQGNSDPFVGILPIPKINDPMYLQLCLPHECNSFGGTKNGNNNFEVLDATAGNLTALCAIYLDPEKEIDDDAVITLCFGEMKMALRKNDGNGWYTAVNSTGPDGIHPGPADLGNIYPIPWTLENDENPVKAYNVGRSKVTWVNDHYEVPVTAADLRGKKFTDPRVTSAVFHTWSTFYNFDAAYNIEGIATAYTVWVKEPQWSGYLTADTGADVRQEGQYCRQTFSSRYFVVTDQPRVVYGHNVGPKAYDEVMDSKTVCRLLGIE